MVDPHQRRAGVLANRLPVSLGHLDVGEDRVERLRRQRPRFLRVAPALQGRQHIGRQLRRSVRNHVDELLGPLLRLEHREDLLGRHSRPAGGEPPRSPVIPSGARDLRFALQHFTEEAGPSSLRSSERQAVCHPDPERREGAGSAVPSSPAAVASAGEIAGPGRLFDKQPAARQIAPSVGRPRERGTCNEGFARLSRRRRRRRSGLRRRSRRG